MEQLDIGPEGQQVMTAQNSGTERPAVEDVAGEPREASFFDTLADISVVPWAR